MTTITVHTPVGAVPVTYTERGHGRPYLVLHGGAGSRSVTDFADLLAAGGDARVITPVTPGFDGTPRPSALTAVADLAATFLALIDEVELVDVTVVGNSIGGWVAAEMALLADPHVSGVVLVDAVGLRLDHAPIQNFFQLSMDEVTDISYFEPERFRIDVDALPEAVRLTMAGNRATMLDLAGAEMSDPTLLERLGAVTVPVLVVWGAADAMVSPAHGHAYAEAIPGARLDLIEHAGHLPQIETPARLVDDVVDFARERTPGRAG